MGKAVRLGRAMGKGWWGEQWKGAVREGRGRTMGRSVEEDSGGGVTK